jgi:hypothetical protein
MKTRHLFPHRIPSGLALALGVMLAVPAVQAAPYACDITNNAGTVSFRLNEAADNVKIISSGGAVTNDLGPGVKGLTVTNLGIAGGHIKAVVLRSAPAGYTQISNDGYQDNEVYVNKYEHPRGLVVNKNPASPSFGRIYVANARGQADTAGPYVRTTYQGIYMLNSDNTVALDTGTFPRTAGLGFTPNNTATPNRLTIGKDDGLLYICDFSDPSGGLWVCDLDVESNALAMNALAGIGDLSYGSTTHGSTYGVVVQGTFAASNLKIWTLDEDLTPLRSVWRYDVNSDPYPHTGSPAGPLATLSIANFASKLVRGGVNDYFYLSQNRSAGTDGPSIRVFDESGTEITNSLAASRAYLNNSGAADLLRNTTAIDISPDGSTLALLRGASFGSVLLVPLTDGVFNFAATNAFSLGANGASDNNRDIAYDAAGNLYACNTATEWFRIYSRGGATVATTGTDGTFEIGLPQILVGVSASVATAREEGPVNGQFTITRSGDLGGPLTVNYTLAGTAVNGTDYNSIPLSLTFAAGQATTNILVIPVNDAEAEFTETVIFTLSGSANYGISTTTATVAIVDNDPTELSITVTQPTLLESFAGAKATLRITRKGLTNSAVTANISYATGTATLGVDFNAVTSTNVAAAAATRDFNITPINDLVYEGTETVIATLTGGAGYVVGTPASATAFIIDDDLPATTVLFADRFDSDTSANWVVNAADGGADTFAEFGYNYSADSIPESPSSTGVFAATRGLKFRVNESLALLNGLSVSPLNKTFTGDYRLRFDMWLNFNGPLAAGGTGSTEHLGAGVGTSGLEAVWPSNPGQGVWFTASSDGQVGESEATRADYGVFMAYSLQDPSAGSYAAGTNLTSRGNLDPYYNLWGGLAAPAGQLGANPSQTGITAIGSMGMAWHTVTITKQGTNVTWDIDGRRIATVDITGQTLGDNVFVGYHDWYISVATNTAVQFGLVDNVRVEDLVPVAPPSRPNITLIRIVGGNVEIDFTADPADTPSSFVLQESSVVIPGSAYADVISGTTITGSSGNFKAERAAGTAPKFYRIRRN